MNLTNYLEEKLAKHAFNIASFTMPSAIYVALFTSDPGEAGSQTSEVSGGTYARQTMGQVWNTDHVENTAIIRFDDMPACTVSHVAILDASTAGNMLWYGPLTSSRAVPATFPFEIAAGSLQAELD